MLGYQRCCECGGCAQVMVEIRGEEYPLCYECDDYLAAEDAMGEGEHDLIPPAPVAETAEEQAA
jgi:hypothetical protein